MVRKCPPDDEARVVVHESGQVDALMPAQQKRKDVGLPKLVGASPFETAWRLGGPFALDRSG